MNLTTLHKFLEEKIISLTDSFLDILQSRRFLFILISVHLVAIFSASISQDDYSTLADIASSGALGPIQNIWNGMGGNISSLFPRILFLSFNSTPPLNFGLIVFSASTFFLVYKSMDILLASALKGLGRTPKTTRQNIALLFIFGFEGLFTPGIASLTAFSAAAAVHVWPVCFIVISTSLLFQGFPKWTLAVLLLAYSANSNVPEGLLTIAFVLMYSIYGAKYSQFRYFRFRALILQVIVGISFVLIFLAPGFSRRSANVGINVSIETLASLIPKNYVIFVFDIATHPFIYLSFLLGILLTRRNSFEVPNKILALLALSSFVYLSLLVVGASVAYPSWHQNLGMYVLLTPLAFFFGIFMQPHFSISGRITSLATACLIVLMLSLVIRAEVLIVHRKIVFNQNFERNICALAHSSKATLAGSEIRYPPFYLGIEDMNRWEWMASGFESWVTSSASLRAKCLH